MPQLNLEIQLLLLHLNVRLPVLLLPLKPQPFLFVPLVEQLLLRLLPLLLSRRARCRRSSDGWDGGGTASGSGTTNCCRCCVCVCCWAS